MHIERTTITRRLMHRDDAFINERARSLPFVTGVVFVAVAVVVVGRSPNISSQRMHALLLLCPPLRSHITLEYEVNKTKELQCSITI